MERFVLAIDQGTTQSTALLVDMKGEVRGKCSIEFEQIYPQPGWVEHDPVDIWSSVEVAIEGVLAKTSIDPARIDAIGVTNQRETTVLWDRTSGEPLCNAIVWQCRRSTDICERLKNEGHEAAVHGKTGLVLDPYFSASKLTWIFENPTAMGLPDTQDRSNWAFGTIDSYLIYRLTGGAAHVTDLSNASRTLLCDINWGVWDDGLLELFGVPKEILPRIVSSSGVVGETRGMSSLPDGIPIAGIAGDQQAALFGQTCFNPGDSKCTYGTGGFMMVNVGGKPVFSNNGLLSTVAWKIGGQVTYALEGAVFIAGAAVQWLRDGLEMIKTAAEIEDLALTVDDNGGVVFVPALAGLGAPHWRPEARGLVAGITRGTRKGHVARACLEGIAMQVSDLAEAMEQDSGTSLDAMRVDGGAAANDLLMQLQADLMRTNIVRPHAFETTALGVAYLAGMAVGSWDSLDDLRAAWSEERRFEPQMDEDERQRIQHNWKAALARA